MFVFGLKGAKAFSVPNVPKAYDAKGEGRCKWEAFQVFCLTRQRKYGILLL